MKKQIAAFASGLLFAVGLALSGMTRPSKVLGFLDLTGRWDPSLALVMVGAVAVHASALWIGRRMRRPLVSDAFMEPGSSRPDRSLVLGALVFGIGWGLVGYCPGPAFSALGAGYSQAAIFVTAMVAGMGAVHAMRARKRAEAPCGASSTSELAYQLDEA